MKITCTVERSDRQLPSLSMASRRPQTAVLSIGKGSSAGDICILHQTLTNKEGTKYKVKDNIQQVFTRFINEGKATLRFKAPPHDLAIRCDTVQLKSFLNVLRLALQGKDLSRGAGGLSTLTPAVQVKKPKSKLIITCKSKYPTLEGFPRTLEVLEIAGIDQTRFDDRILRLQQLCSLDLSGNKLKSLPVGLGRLPKLRELKLSHNELGLHERKPGAWDWVAELPLSSKLQLLDLSHNGLTAVPVTLGGLSALVTLKLDHNNLVVLNSNIGRMPSLRFLSASHNQLEYLPGSITKMTLESIDVTHNPFNGRCPPSLAVITRLLSLKELAAREVIHTNIRLTAADVPLTVLRFMQSCDFCICGAACFNRTLSLVVSVAVRKFSISSINAMCESESKPVRFTACSDRCLGRIVV